MADAATMGNVPFLWEGTDRKGNKIKGKSMAANEDAVRADLRRQGVVPSRIRKQGKSLILGVIEDHNRGHSNLQPAACNDAGCRYSAGPGLRDRGQRGTKTPACRN